MELEISKIFKEIFKLAIYDQDAKTYYLSKQNYEILGLSDKRIRRKINELCTKLNINLDYPNKPLPEIKDEELFEEYNSIQSKLKNNPSLNEKEKLEKRRIILRNKITEDNLELIKVIINRRIYNIHNSIDKEDAYQFGYEMLIYYIDKSYLDKEKMKLDINCELILYIENQILHTRKNISTYQEEQVSKLKQVKENESSTTINSISEKTYLKESQIRTLTNLENILSSISIEELKDIEENILSVESYISKEYISQLYDDTYEEKLIEQLEISRCINLIIETLPKDKQNIINLYYGLNDNSRYNMPQIAKMYNMTKAGVSFIIVESLEIIRNSLRMTYLQECLQDISLQKDISNIEQKDILNSNLEDRLIRNLPNYILNKIITKLNKEQRIFLELYCQKENYSIREISKILNISIKKLYQIKRKTIKTIRINILKEMSIFKEDAYLTYDIYYQYIKYLMNIHSHKINIKKRG